MKPANDFSPRPSARCVWHLGQSQLCRWDSIRPEHLIASGAMCHVELESLNAITAITIPSTFCLLFCKNAYFAVLAVEGLKSFRAVFDVILQLYHGPFSQVPNSIRFCARRFIARATAHLVMGLPVTVVSCYFWGSAAPSCCQFLASKPYCSVVSQFTWVVQGWPS